MASFNSPGSVAISPDRAFALVADYSNNRVRRILIATGAVTTLAGSGLASFADGIGAMAAFNQLTGITISPDGVFSLVADTYNHRVRRIVIATGAVTTLAGSGTPTFADGAGAQASFQYPTGVCISPNGTLAFVADQSNQRVRRIAIATGMVSTLAGSSTAGSANGAGAQASFNQPIDVAISPDSAFLLVADWKNHRVRRILIGTGEVTTLAGLGSASFADGTGAQASFNQPRGIAISPDGSFALLADEKNQRVRRITIATGAVTTLAGSSLAALVDGTGTLAAFNSPSGVSISPDGAFALVADSKNHRVRHISLASPCPVTAYCPTSGMSISEPCLPNFYCATTGLSAVSGPCDFGAYCAGGASSPGGIPCPPGSYCQNLTSLPCLRGYFCAGGLHTPPAACPAGTFCGTAGLSAPTPCVGGFFCNTAGLSAPTGQCTVGQVCPAGASAAATCPLGMLCQSAGLSVATPCAAGSSCSATVQSPCTVGMFALGGASACTQCPRGSFSSTAGSCANRLDRFFSSVSRFLLPLVCSTVFFFSLDLSGASTCSLCTAGSYVTNTSSSTCTACPPGMLCSLGATAPTAPRATGKSSFNPFTTTNAQNQEAVFEIGKLVLFGCGPVVLFIIALGIVGERSPRLQHALGTCCGSCSFVNWSRIDMFSVGDKQLTDKRAAFGVSMSFAAVVVFLGAGAILGVNTVMFPIYESSVSPQPPPWEPIGVFELVVTVLGGGSVEQCAAGPANGFGIFESRRVDWSVLPTRAPNAYNETDGSCTLSWRCDGRCTMLAASSATLQLRSPSRSWVNFVQFAVVAPLFASGTFSLVPDFGVLPFRIERSFYVSADTIPSHLNSSLRGAASINLALTPYVINASSTATKAVAFEPSVLGLEFGDGVTTLDSFDFGAADGFTLNFVLNRNSLSLVFASASSTAVILTFLLLLSSLAGVIFKVCTWLLKLLRALCSVRDPVKSLEHMPQVDAVPTDESRTDHASDINLQGIGLRASVNPLFSFGGDLAPAGGDVATKQLVAGSLDQNQQQEDTRRQQAGKNRMQEDKIQMLEEKNREQETRIRQLEVAFAEMRKLLLQPATGAHWQRAQLSTGSNYA